jgi:Xaa-Pro aminopeptidase
MSVLNGEEQKVMRRAAAIACAMMVAGKTACKEGVREVDVAIEIHHAMERVEPLAVQAFRQMVMSGERGGYLDRPSTNKIILRGDMVSIDVGCRYMGYCCEFERHVMIGKPTEEQKRLYEAAFESQQAAVNALKPGASVLEIDRIARDVIEKAGFGDYQMAHYTGHQHGLGHSPLIGDPGQTEDYILEPGMVCAIEPGIFKPGVGGVRVEDSVLITETGHEILSNIDYCQELLD